jgi:2-keto-3-deoxy-L-rhamnonate aldolase RhmA
MNTERKRAVISPWVNPVTRALKAGKVCVGACSIAFGSVPTAQIFGAAGFSFNYFDLEHSQTSIEDLAAMCAASKLVGAVPIVGPSSIGDHLIGRPLDAGAMGVIVPHVSTAEETERVVQYSRYAPVGIRGLVSPGILTEFESPDGSDWVEAQNREILVAVKVESGTGIDNIEEIAAVPGLDAILIGPGDLSATLGIPGQTGHADVIDCVERMLAAAKKNGVAGGPHVGNSAEAEVWADKGARFMSISFDGGMLLEIATNAVDEARARLGDRML